MKILSLFIGLLLFGCSLKTTTLNRIQNRRIASVEDQVKAIDPNRKTLCTVTINSTDETEIFLKHLTNYNHIELVPGKDIEHGWFENACNSGVQCDVLVISGHFGGEFFSDESSTKLQGSLLESLSCRKSCPGILHNPKDVYLFGCNTLAGKEKDNRTADEYIATLVRDNFSYSEAQMLAAIRYSPFGNSFSSKMRRSFANVVSIHGFDSIAPSGANVRKSLDKYLKAVGNFSEFQDNHPATDHLWKKHMTSYTATEVKGSTLKEAYESTSCRLTDNNTPRASKLFLINQLLSSEEKILENIEYLDDYFENEYRYNSYETTQGFKARMTKLAETFFSNQIKLSKNSKEVFLKYMQQEIPGLISLQASLLNLGNKFGWWTPAEYQTAVKNIFGDFKKGISAEKADVICNKDIRVSGLTIDDFRRDKWNLGELLTINCLQVRDLKIAEKILNDFTSGKSSDPEIESFAVLTAVSSGQNSPKMEKAVKDQFLSLPRSFLESAEWTLTGYFEYFLRNGTRCSECMKNTDVILSRENTTNNAPTKASALVYRLRNQPTEAHLEQAVQFVFSGSYSGGKVRNELSSDKTLCPHLKKLVTLEDQYLPKDHEKWMFVEETSPSTSLTITGMSLTEEKMRFTDELKSYCYNR